MAYESIKVKEIVDRAISNTWSIPEFQRGFVWKPSQVRDLVESLWRNYPIGNLLIWNSGISNNPQPKTATDGLGPRLWIVDGQQRATALGILFARKPYWWPDVESWEKTLEKYDIRFDISAQEPPYFFVANAAIRNVKGNRYIPLCKLLNLDIQGNSKDQQTLQLLAESVVIEGLCPGMSSLQIYSILDKICKIRDMDVVTVTVHHELEDVVEIFSRLNSKGTRVTEADIYLGIVAARNPGWVRGTFLPYRTKLQQYGFDVNPNLLFRTVTAVGGNKVRFREIPDSFWDNFGAIDPDDHSSIWNKTTLAWENLIRNFKEFGVASNDILPTETALVTMVALLNRFPNGSFHSAFYWFLQASRFGRYSGSSATSQEEDLRDISESVTLSEAVKKMLRRFVYKTPLTEEDFMRDYTDTPFGRFFLYLLVYRSHAKDWDEKGHRIGFEGNRLLEGYNPQWHHVFPKKYLDHFYSDDLINPLANIAVIGPGINIRINNKAPMDYIIRYKITSIKLQQQYIDENITQISIEDYVMWVQARAKVLAKEGNDFLDLLGGEF